MLATQTLHWEVDRFNKGKNKELLAALNEHTESQAAFTAKAHEVRSKHSRHEEDKS